MNRRRLPSPATASSALPSLASIVAAGLAAEGCAPVECGDARADEIRHHGPDGVTALRRGEVAAGLREVAIAAGLVTHPPTRVDPRLVPGSERAVSPEPPPSMMRGSGQMMGVSLQGVDPPTEVRPTRDPFERPREVVPMGGAPPRVTPEAPPPPPPPPPPAHPRRREMPLGDMKSVGPEPK